MLNTYRGSGAAVSKTEVCEQQSWKAEGRNFGRWRAHVQAARVRALLVLAPDPGVYGVGRDIVWGTTRGELARVRARSESSPDPGVNGVDR